MQTREQAEADYDTQLARLVTSLRALAGRVEHAGDAQRLRTVGLSSQRIQPDRTFLASDVHDLILGWVGERNSHLTSLMFAAIQAEHAAARATPAEMLDAAATALGRFADIEDPERAAEVALRGAGVIR